MTISTARPIDWLIFILAAVFFSSNLIFGRGISADVGPFITAFLRWSGAALFLLPFVYRDRQESLPFMRRHAGIWLLLGFLGMGVCGVTVIVLKGDWRAALHFRFNVGDLGILAAAIAWAAYSLLLRRPEVRRLAPLSLFGTVCLAGALLLAPVALYEAAAGAPLPDSLFDWTRIAGIIVFASLLAFSCFQHAVRVLGASTAGLSLYLMPPISIMLAAIFLGESFETYHAAGIVLVMGGVILATAPLPRRSQAM